MNNDMDHKSDGDDQDEVVALLKKYEECFGRPFPLKMAVQSEWAKWIQTCLDDGKSMDDHFPPGTIV